MAATGRNAEDSRGMQCPGPLMKVNDMMKTMADGKKLAVTASDPGFVRDIRAWAKKTGNAVTSSRETNGEYYAVIRKGPAEGTDRASAGAVSAPASAAAASPAEKDGQTIIVFSGDFDTMMACTMSMDVMGIRKEELIDGVQLAGVGTYLGAADDAGSNLFI